MIELYINNNDVCIIDDIDSWVLGYKWRKCRGYAQREPMKNGKRKTILMHREILGLTDRKFEVDHINSNRLDNRRCNLRKATRAQNSQNRARGYGTSQYRGVAWRAANRAWCAYGQLKNHEGFHLGYYDVELDAAKFAEAFRRTHLPFHVPNLSLEKVDCICKMCKSRLEET